MKKILRKIIKANRISPEQELINKLVEKYRNFSMISPDVFAMNLELCKTISHIEGDIVECGVWRGGMIAAMAELFGSERNYYLFDSFEGLPQVQEIDGPAAKKWQENTNNPFYYDNCKAEMSFAIEAMNLALPRFSDNVIFKKGWFNVTMVKENLPPKVALLRLDADWYESTFTCLNALYPLVVEGGIILIDDYYTWDGCSKAVHDYLSKNKCAERIEQWNNCVAYIKKIS